MSGNSTLSINQRATPSSGTTAAEHNGNHVDMTNGPSTVLDGMSYILQYRAILTPDAGHSTLALAENQQRLISSIQKLSTLGIDATLPSLPKIVVVGDQSHGKSSIVEALCAVSLPRAEGTCTRCPFELVTTSSTAEWQCEVSLHKKWRHVLGSTSSKAIRWDPLTQPEIVRFATVTNKDSLEHALQRAQIAILNPQLQATTVLHNSEVVQSNALNFSPNVVHLKISGPGLPELSLYDLPGAINVTESEDDMHLVDFVKELIEGYVKEPKAIILLTVAANQDVETCRAFNIVRQEKATLRCKGVLTKPDLIASNGTPLDRIRQMLNRSKWPLGEGWHVTKSLSQNDINLRVTHSQAREQEMAFFSEEPWGTTLSEFCDLFGIRNLQSALSRKLTEHILSEYVTPTAFYSRKTN
jgi:GTPase SAR1 family protein